VAAISMINYPLNPWRLYGNGDDLYITRYNYAHSCIT